jgi:hypothetical protein
VPARTLECGEFSPLSVARVLAPQSLREAPVAPASAGESCAPPPVPTHGATRRAAQPTSRLLSQSGENSPHSKTHAAKRASPSDDNNLTKNNLSAHFAMKNELRSSGKTLAVLLQPIANALRQSRRRHRTTRATDAVPTLEMPQTYNSPKLLCLS